MTIWKIPKENTNPGGLQITEASTATDIDMVS